MMLEVIYMDESNAIIRVVKTREIFCLVDETEKGRFKLTNLWGGVVDDRVVDIETFTRYWC